jgi:hypothetical protein
MCGTVFDTAVGNKIELIKIGLLEAATDTAWAIPLEVWCFDPDDKHCYI